MMAQGLPGGASLRQHDRMLFVHEHDEHGQERVLVLPLGSVVSYFTDREEGKGMVLHVEAGMLAFPSEFEAHREAVRDAVLAEAGRRMQVPPEEVVYQQLAQLRAVTDPDISGLTVTANRRRSKGRSGPFLR